MNYRMNYIKEINAFYNWLLYNSLSTGAIALWHALMSINNKADWDDEFTVANTVLQGMTGLSRQGLHKARNLLIQKGLIEYKKGRSNQAGKYKMISLVRHKVDTVVDAEVDTPVDTNFFECKKVDTEVDTEKLECKKVDTPVDTVVDAPVDTVVDTLVAHYINKTKLNNNNNIYIYNMGNQKMEDIKKIFSYWNEKGIIEHKQLNKKIMTVLNSALDNYSLEEICRAIDNYAIILNSDKYYWTYKCSLIEFVEKNLDKFMDFDTAAKNYTRNSIETSGHGLNKTMDFNKYEQHEYTDEQLESLFEPIGEGYF